MSLTSLEQHQASQVMTKSLLAARSDWTVAELAQFLVSSGITGAPVVDSDEQLVGVVSVTDIARHASGDMQDEQSDSGRGYYVDGLEFDHEHVLFEELSPTSLGGTRVEEIMTPTIFDVTPDTNLSDVSKAMVQNKIHRVFVSENQKVIGVVSALDVLKMASE